MLLTGVVLILFVAIGAVAAELWYGRVMVGELRSDADLIMSQASTHTGDYQEYAGQMSKVLAHNGNEVRVTIIDISGRVLGDSDADSTTMENHSNRPEIQQALRGGWGTAQRYSATLRVRMLYVATHPGNSQVLVRTSIPMYELQAVHRMLALFFAASLLLMLGLAGLVARGVSRRLARPIEELTGITSRIAAGDYHLPTPPTDDPEFRELSDGLVKLAKDLNEHLTALEQTNTQLRTVLTSINEGFLAIDGEGRLLFINGLACELLGLRNPDELTGQRAGSLITVKAINELVAECLANRAPATVEVSLPTEPQTLITASAAPMHEPAAGCILLMVNVTQLRKLENMRHDFVANVTHELRTPLTSIRGYVETLQAGALQDPELSARFLQIIEIESERLSNLISDLLYLSEIESGNQDTGIRPFRLAEVANGVVDMLSMVATARHVTIACQVPGNIMLEANPDRIKQLLLNLADNAVKYNREDGTVTIGAERSSSLVRFWVKDTGIGIPEEHASRIFERFYRIDKGRSRAIGGTGLGLSIVKHIVDLYHGNIRLISSAGQGSEFIIELPARYEAKKKN